MISVIPQAKARLYAPISGGSGGTISGFAYPGETLTSTALDQWRVNGVNRGSPSTTFIPGVNDIGLIIDQSTSVNSVTCWHPKDISQVKIIHLGNFGALNNSLANASNNDPVRRIGNLASTPYTYAHSGASTSTYPIYKTNYINGNNVLQFDGSNDYMNYEDFNNTSSGANSPNNIFRNIGYGYIFSATGGAQSNGVDPGDICRCNNGSSPTSSTRLRVAINSIQNFQAGGRRIDSDSFVSISSTGNAGWNVLTAESRWTNGVLNLRVNGLQTNTTNYASSGNTSDTSGSSSGGIGIGSAPDGSIEFCKMDLAGLILASGNTALTSTEISRIERYLGLLIGVDIPLV
jgi:hypothetical protein